jgi:large subunit ribosomal protein L9
MKVLLKEDVDNLGYAGEVFDVAAGYGRNYLIPQGLAVRATPKVMRQAEIWRRKAETRRAELRAEHAILAKRIEEVTLTFLARAGSTGRLYGSVTTAQIADALNEALGTEIDRRRVGNESLRQLGKHPVVVRLSAEFQPEVTVVVKPEGEIEEAEVAEEFEEIEERIVEAEETESAEADEPEIGFDVDEELWGE